MRKNIYKIMLSAIALVAFTTVSQAKNVMLENLVIGDILEPGDYIANYGSTRTVYTCSSFTAIDNYILDEEITYNPMVIMNAVGMLSDTKYCKLIAIDELNYYFLSYIPATPITITAISNNEAFGTVSGSGTYQDGDPVTLTATPATGCAFVNWTVNDIEVSTDNPYVFNASESVEVTANFQTITSIGDIKNVEFTIYPNPATDKIYIQTPDGTIPQVRLFSPQGTLLQQTNSPEINLANYANGIYLIQINGKTTRIIKQ